MTKNEILLTALLLDSLLAGMEESLKHQDALQRELFEEYAEEMCENCPMRG